MRASTSNCLSGRPSSFTFANAGTYKVTCTIHPTMNMTVTVQ